MGRLKLALQIACIATLALTGLIWFYPLYMSWLGYTIPTNPVQLVMAVVTFLVNLVCNFSLYILFRRDKPTKKGK